MRNGKISAFFASLTVVVLVACDAGTSSPTQIRVRNDSVFDFHDVVADGQAFGAIAAGGTSTYQAHDASSRFAVVHLAIGATSASFEPTGASGGPSLGPGWFTYHVTATPSGSGFWLGVVASAD